LHIGLIISELQRLLKRTAIQRIKDIFGLGSIAGVALKVIRFLYLLPLLAFAEQNLDEMTCAFNYTQHSREILFETTIPVQVKCSYPRFSGEGLLIEYVNEQLKAAAEARFDLFIKEELFSEEPEIDGCELYYDLVPAYQTPELISVFGYHTLCRGCRGISYYEGKNFWQRGGAVVQLTLDDLFLVGSEYRPFLLQYCEAYFKATGYGYYSLHKEYPPELASDDLDIFTLSDKGLLITFRAYRVGGWADGPDQVLIPYEKLKGFINPRGPLANLSK
jgi:Protein of unknown function (DUF3298)